MYPKKSKLRRFAHWVAHQIGWNFGSVETWYREDGVLMVGFRCACGRIEGVHPSMTENGKR